MRVVDKPHRGAREAPLALDPDLVRPVDHHLGDALVRQEALERAVPERVVGDLVDEPLAVAARDSRLLLEPFADVRHHTGSQRRRISVGVHELRAQIADYRHMNAVLDLGEAVRLLYDDRRLTLAVEPFVELHQDFLLRPKTLRRPDPFSAATGA
jgi:hypothetical protein